MKLERYENNPILSPKADSEWETRCVLNPAVVYDDEMQKFVMVYRSAGDDKRHEICMGLATSDDGKNFVRQSDKPVFAPNQYEPDGGCVEDPRIVQIGDAYFMTYAARTYAPGQYWLDLENLSPCYTDETDVIADEMPDFAKRNITVSYLAMTKDFKKYKRLGRITEATVDDRDVFLFPEKVNEKYVLISRPKFKNVGVKMPSIWISFGDDLIDYEKPELLMTGREWWETARIGAGAPPIKTDKGWFMLYHGVDDKGIYRVGAVLMDLNDPRKILARTKNYLMEPEAPYETEGLYNGCVFPTGNVVKDGILYVYYGCADKYVSLATANFDELIKYLWTECKED